jgi:hypothetical protein
MPQKHYRDSFGYLAATGGVKPPRYGNSRYTPPTRAIRFKRYPDPVLPPNSLMGSDGVVRSMGKVIGTLDRSTGRVAPLCPPPAPRPDPVTGTISHAKPDFKPAETGTTLDVSTTDPVTGCGCSSEAPPALVLQYVAVSPPPPSTPIKPATELALVRSEPSRQVLQNGHIATSANTSDLGCAPAKPGSIQAATYTYRPVEVSIASYHTPGQGILGNRDPETAYLNQLIAGRGMA